MPGRAGETCLTEEAHDTRSRPKVAEQLKAARAAPTGATTRQQDTGGLRQRWGLPQAQ